MGKDRITGICESVFAISPGKGYKAGVSLIERHILGTLALATLVVACALVAVVFLSQSLRFLELVMNAGASASLFWMLTALALPRFLEVILPIALTAAAVFVYHRMTMDSEIVVLRAAGVSPLRLARPVLIAAGAMTVFLWILAAWIAPASVSQMKTLRHMLKTQYSSLAFREGVFSPVGEGITVFVRARGADGALEGILIHDARPSLTTPVTIMARSGTIVSAPDGDRIVVREGSRQEYDREKRILRKLDFESYAMILPESAPEAPRGKDPDERGIFELLFPSAEDAKDPRAVRLFRVEAHKRIAAPLLAPALAACALALLLLGGLERRGREARVALCIALVVAVEAAFLASYNLCRQSDWGLLLMYLSALGPLAAGLYALSPAREQGGAFLAARGGSAS